MPDIRQDRPDSVVSRRMPTDLSDRWVDRAASWIKDTTGSLARAVADEPMTDRFADLAAKAREPEEVRVELVRLASIVTGAARVELFDDREARSPRRVASWPPALFPAR